MKGIFCLEKHIILTIYRNKEGFFCFCKIFEEVGLCVCGVSRAGGGCWRRKILCGVSHLRVRGEYYRCVVMGVVCRGYKCICGRDGVAVLRWYQARGLWRIIYIRKGTDVYRLYEVVR